LAVWILELLDKVDIGFHSLVDTILRLEGRSSTFYGDPEVTAVGLEVIGFG
jgi:hypothetical protein